MVLSMEPLLITVGIHSQVKRNISCKNYFVYVLHFFIPTSGGFSNFIEADGFGTFKFADNGRIYSGPFLKGQFDTSGKIYFYLLLSNVN